MTTITLRHPPGLNRDQSQACFTSGQRHWWVRDEYSNEFLDIGSHMAIYPLCHEINLQPGDYVLGCGTGNFKLRRRFIVDMMGYKFV